MHVKLSLSHQFSSKPSIAVLSAWPIHYACVWGPFVTAFDVLSVGRWWNLPASRLTTEPYFSPSDSKEVSSWQRFERETVVEIDCGTMMWEEVTHSLSLKGTNKRWSEHRWTQRAKDSLAPIRFWPLPSVLESLSPFPTVDVPSTKISSPARYILALGFKLYLLW